jgi:hypothetical protein
VHGSGRRGAAPNRPPRTRRYEVSTFDGLTQS